MPEAAGGEDGTLTREGSSADTKSGGSRVKTRILDQLRKTKEGSGSRATSRLHLPGRDTPRTSQSTLPSLEGFPVVIEGWLKRKKPNTTVKSWQDRYFVLRGRWLEVFTKPGEPLPQALWMLESGCTVTPVSMVVRKSKNLYMFKVTWPRDPSEAAEEGEAEEEPINDHELEEMESDNGDESDNDPEHNQTLKNMAEIERARHESTNKVLDRLQPSEEEKSAQEKHDEKMQATEAQIAKENADKTKLMNKLKVGGALTAGVTVGLLTAGVGLAGLLVLGAGAGVTGASGIKYLKLKKNQEKKQLILATGCKSDADKWRQYITEATSAGCSTPTGGKSPTQTPGGGGLTNFRVPSFRRVQTPSKPENENTDDADGSIHSPPGSPVRASSPSKSRHRHRSRGNSAPVLNVGRAAATLAHSRWKCRDVVNGLRIREAVGIDNELPLLRCQTVIYATPFEILVSLLEGSSSMSGGGMAEKGSSDRGTTITNVTVIEKMNDFCEIIAFRTGAHHLGMGVWAAPRQFCVCRQWLETENSFVICMDSTNHNRCPPLPPGHVRGRLHSVMTISGRLDGDGSKRNNASLLTHYLRVDPMGWIWRYGGFAARYTEQVIPLILDSKDMIEAVKFSRPRLPALGQDMDMPATEEGGSAPPSPKPCKTAMDTTHPLIKDIDDPCLDMSMWSDIEATAFSVRGATYKQDKVKCNSAQSKFELHAVDLVTVEEPTLHLSQYPGSRLRQARANGYNEFIWVLSLMVPGPPHIYLIMYLTPRKGADLEKEMEEGTPFGVLYKDVMLNGTNEELDARLKLIPRVTEGNFVVKRACPPTPAILGKKLAQHHFRGDNYLETSVDIGSSRIAAQVTKLTLGYAKNLVVELGWVMQGETEEELPEVVIGGLKIIHVDMSIARPFNPNGNFPLQFKFNKDGGTKITDPNEES